MSRPRYPGVYESVLSKHSHGDTAMQGDINQILKSSVYSLGRLASVACCQEYHDAEDILQGIAVGMWQAESRRHISEPDRYVRRAIRNSTIDRHRREERRVKLVRDSGLSGALAPAGVDWAQVDDLVEMLPRAERNTVRRMLDGMGNAEIAAIDGVSTNTVRKRISRARERMTDALMR
ncbi:MAG: RNA polymerase sigma factor [Planctomycetota bacterium]|nr:RNA polymerase sigma factor [Planctomycetota bacterium]